MSAAIAIDHLRRGSIGTRLADLAMSNLVVRAMEGDATAPVILRHALMAIAHLDPSDGRPASLAAGWTGGITCDRRSSHAPRTRPEDGR